jgi:alpha-glucosidase
VIDSYPGRVLIGEIYLPLKDLMTYYGQDLNGANLPFNFLLLQCQWNAQTVARVISEYMTMLPQGAWPNWVLGNHDNNGQSSKRAVYRRCTELLQHCLSELVICDATA